MIYIPLMIVYTLINNNLCPVNDSLTRLIYVSSKGFSGLVRYKSCNSFPSKLFLPGMIGLNDLGYGRLSGTPIPLSIV
jgi:hypothetical protein